MQDKLLEQARQECRNAYAKHGMSPEYEAAFDRVTAITSEIESPPVPAGWCTSDGEWGS